MHVSLVGGDFLWQTTPQHLDITGEVSFSPAWLGLVPVNGGPA